LSAAQDGLRTTMRSTLPLLLLVPACVSADYSGILLPPTDSVIVYYELEDVARPNKVMGHLQAEILPGTDYPTVESLLVERAMAKGADALVVEGADMVDAGARTPGIRYEPVHYRRSPDGEIVREDVGDRPTPDFTYGIRNRVLNALLVDLDPPGTGP